MEPTAVFTDYLTKNGHRMTNQRGLILDAFLKREGHFTAEELYGIVRRKDRTIGQATVYRNLKLLLNSGLAREADFGDGTVYYEHNYGHTHHDHIICQKCDARIEVVDPEIEKLQERLAKKHGFTLTKHKLNLYGICPACKKKRK